MEEFATKKIRLSDSDDDIMAQNGECPSHTEDIFEKRAQMAYLTLLVNIGHCS